MPAWTLNSLIRTPLLLLGIGELLILYSSVYLSALVLDGGIDNYQEAIEQLRPRAAVFTMAMMAGLIATGLYNFHQRIKLLEVLARVAVGLALGSLAYALVSYLFPSVAITPQQGAISFIYVLALLMGFRFVFLRHVDENLFRHRTLIYGAGERANAIADLRRKADRRGFKIVGSVPAPGDRAEFGNTGKLIHDRAIDRLAQELDADEIVIAMDDRRGNLPIRQLLDCKFRGINVIDLLEFLERETGKIRIDLVNPGWLIFSPGFRSGPVRLWSKRLVDLAVSVMLLGVSWPIMLLIALAIKVEDGFGASVLFHQIRVGNRGRPFTVLKFRSMRENAEKDGKAVWAEENDPRITRVGRMLRKFRLDELPQIFNVISGQMSLVGPRPERPEFVDKLSESVPYYSERHTMKPGITGWAQLRYSYGSTEMDAVEKLQYDLYYIKNHNLLLDLVIILQTAEVVLWGKGAR